MNIELTSEQRQAMRSLKDALTHMEARGLGVDAIAFVLDQTFSGICNDLCGGTSETNWHRKSDPYFYSGPSGRIRAAESTIVPTVDEPKK
jgi:hypothetical protein